MTTRTWLGGGNDSAGNPADWSPTGAPQPGDTLLVPLTGLPIDIYGNDLRGDTLTLENQPSIQSGGPRALNLFDGAQLSLNESPVAYENPIPTIDVHGFATLTVTTTPAQNSYGIHGAGADVNLSPGAVLLGNFSMGGGPLDISGGADTALIVTGTSTLEAMSAVIDTNVIGAGTIDVSPFIWRGASVEFGGFVSPGEVVAVLGQVFPTASGREELSSVIVDHPSEFFGTVELETLSVAEYDAISNAAGWNYSHDVLTILGTNGRAIDRLNVISDDSSSSVHGLSLTQDAAGDVIVGPGTSFHGTIASVTTS